MQEGDRVLVKAVGAQGTVTRVNGNRCNVALDDGRVARDISTGLCKLIASLPPQPFMLCDDHEQFKHDTIPEIKVSDLLKLHEDTYPYGMSTNDLRAIVERETREVQMGREVDALLENGWDDDEPTLVRKVSR